jgi:hypothetical protein
MTRLSTRKQMLVEYHMVFCYVNQKENAEAYNREIYPEVQKLLAKVIEGTPQVQTYEVSRSTFHKIAARATA